MAPAFFSPSTIRNFCSGLIRAKMAARADPRGAFGLAERGQLVSRDDQIVVVQDAGGFGHGMRRQRMVAGDHLDADAGALALGHRARHLGPQRILEAQQAIHREIALVLVPTGAEPVHAPGREREHAQPLRGEPARSPRAPRGARSASSWLCARTPSTAPFAATM